MIATLLESPVIPMQIKGKITPVIVTVENVRVAAFNVHIFRLYDFSTAHIQHWENFYDAALYAKSVVGESSMKGYYVYDIVSADPDVPTRTYVGLQQLLKVQRREFVASVIRYVYPYVWEVGFELPPKPTVMAKILRREVDVGGDITIWNKSMLSGDPLLRNFATL